MAVGRAGRDGEAARQDRPREDDHDEVADLDLVRGSVRAVSPSLDPATRTGTVYVDLPQPGGLRAGMFAQGFIHLGDTPDLYLYQGVQRLDPSTRSAEDTLFELFTDDEVKAALEALPDSFRMPVLLADVEGFSYREIADMLDIPIGTVMSRLHRGRKAMHKRLFDFAVARGLILPESSPDGDSAPPPTEDLHHG